MVTQYKTRNSYTFPVILISSILLGGLTGYLFGSSTRYLKPFGDIFLNLIFTAIVPLIFSVCPLPLHEQALWEN
nr:cation:dicarboxylase symporter family transporter [Legionella tunisiensis]